MTKRQEIEILKGRIKSLEKELTDIAKVCEKTTEILKNHSKLLKEIKNDRH